MPINIYIYKFTISASLSTNLSSYKLAYEHISCISSKHINFFYPGLTFLTLYLLYIWLSNGLNNFRQSSHYSLK